jgi:2-phospho-L-lactate guanylyltransferase (CobY/MobA/RfbA family)
MVGTTALTALRGTDLEPAFGPRSLRNHLRGGAVLLDGEGLEPLRRDVDLVEHLEAVLRLGAGGATRRVVAAESG